MDGLMLHAGATLIGRQDLLTLHTPEGTETHRPIPHHRLVEALVESLAYRKLEAVRDEYAISPDGMRLFGFMALNLEHEGIRLAFGIRNSHDKSFSLGITVGYRVFVCDNLAFHGDFMPIARKHTKHLDIVEVVNGAVDRAQRHFEPMKVQVDTWRAHSLSTLRAKEIIYDAFVEGGLDAPMRLLPRVHEHYFEPVHADFAPRTLWSLSNAFTETFKSLDPIPHFRATASLGRYLADVN
jgi:hypothetical protein